MRLKIPAFQLPSTSEIRTHGSNALHSTLSEDVLISPQFHYAASNLKRVFRLHSSTAPGLVFVGGEFVSETTDGAGTVPDIVSCTGSGLDIESAVAACLGESVEHLSQCMRRDDEEIVGASTKVPHGLSPESVTEVLASAGFTNDQVTRPISWTPAQRLSDGTSALVPTDLCFRNTTGQRQRSPRSKLSTGTACGATRESATLTALLELIERDAVALWWKGGQRGRQVTPEQLAKSGTDELMSHLRCGVTARECWLLDITTDIGIPTFAAISTGIDGKGVAVGAAARLCETDAIHKAITELCQVEVGELLLHLKLSEMKTPDKPQNGLNQTFQNALQRSQFLDAKCCDLLCPVLANDQPDRFTPSISDLQETVFRLTKLEFDVLGVDLTRSDLGVPAVRVIVPRLQLYPSNHVTARLESMIAQTKNQHLVRQEIELM